MCSPDATNGVITWAISPPSRNRVCMASAATSSSRRPCPGLVESSLRHRISDCAGLLDHRHLDVGLDPAGLLHDRVAVDELEVWQVASTATG